MKVLHLISGSLKGGAARGGAWLHLGLRKCGVDSRVLATRVDDSYPYVESVLPEGLWGDAQYYAHVGSELLYRCFYLKYRRSMFSSAVFGFHQIEQHPWFREADIIHLHWINWAMLSLKQIAQIQKPIVWTVRDMWPITGGCHYSMNCQAYKTKCQCCPVLGSHSKNDLSSWNMAQKKKVFSHKEIFWATISPWLAECMKESEILRNKQARVIPNGIDLNMFYPIPKEEARKRLGWNNEEKVILSGAVRLNFPWKGNKEFFDAYRTYLGAPALAMFGDTKNLKPECRALLRYDLGKIADLETLRLVYSAADVFVAPSIQEAFGKTLIEAMACGTPVVCFDATGPQAIVDHKVNGYKAKAFDLKDLSCGIEWVLEDERGDELSAAALKKAANAYNIDVVAAQYKDLYSQVLASGI